MKKALVLSLVAFGLIAETFSALTPDDRYFYFSTQGKDCYADGTPLLDGECYAVVWRSESLKNTTSGLFDADGNAVDPDNCQILAILSAAKRGVKDGQPYAYAEPAWVYIANSVLGPLVDNGVISLFALDTRIWNGTDWVVGGKTSGTTVAALNGYGLVDSLEDLKIGFHIFPHGGRLGPDHSFTNNPDAYMSWGDVNVPYSGATVLPTPSSKEPAPSRLVVEALHFKTTGNDRYADETPVMAGECYALVWQRTGTEFPGLPKEAPDPADREALGEDFWIAGYYPAATGDVAWACCSSVTVASGTLPVDEATNGTWTVYLLDTRYETDGGATACGFDPSEANMPQQINFYAPVAGLTDFELALTASPLVATNLVGGATVADQKSYSYFEVTLDSCGGTPASLSVIRKEGTTVGSLPDQVTRQGYAFAGWYTAAVGGEPVSSATVVTGAVTYCAHWSANKYKVVFDRGDEFATGAMDDQPMTYGQESALSSNLFARVGYTFAGWDDGEDAVVAKYADGAVVSNLTAEADATVTLYAVWTQGDNTVTFDANGGTADETRRIVKTDAQLGALPNASRTGYALAGWFTAPTGGKAVMPDTVVKGDVTYYAQWTANSYTVDFNERGGTGAMDDQPMTYDQEATLSSNLFTRVGYAFLGWTDDVEELDDVLYYDGVVVSNLTDEANGEYDLYAIWAANEYSVTFHANGGEGTMDEQVFLYDEAKRLTANAFVRSGYTFAGWDDGEDAVVAKYADGAVVSNLTDEAGGEYDLYAVWAANAYVVKFNANGGEGTMGEQVFLYDEAKRLSPVDFDREGYGFAGWATAADGEVVYADCQLVSNLTALAAGVYELFAVWTQGANDVRFDANGGMASFTRRSVKTDDPVGELPTAERERFELIGWFTAPAGGERISESTVVTCSVTYYAQWRRIEWDGKVENDWLKVTCAHDTVSLGLGEEVLTDADHYFAVDSGSTATLKVSGLPTGVKFDAKKRTMSGKATKKGVFYVTVTATNKSKFTQTRVMVMKVGGAEPDDRDEIGINCTALSNLVVGTSLPAGTVTIPSGASASGLPKGLKIVKKGAVDAIGTVCDGIEGIPTKGGKFTIKVTAKQPNRTTLLNVIVRDPGSKYIAVDSEAGGTATKSGVYAAGATLKLTAKAESKNAFIGWMSDVGDVVRPDGVDYRSTSLSMVVGEMTPARFTACFEPSELDAADGVAVVPETGEWTFDEKSGSSEFRFRVDSDSLPKVAIKPIPSGFAFNGVKDIVVGEDGEQYYRLVVKDATKTKPGVYNLAFNVGNASVKQTPVTNLTLVVKNKRSGLYDLEYEKPYQVSVGVGDVSQFPAFAVPGGAKVSVSGLPSGLKYKNGVITGVATKAGEFTVTITTTINKVKVVDTVFMSVDALPAQLVGTFNGVVTNDDVLATEKLVLTATDKGKITAKIGTLSLSQTGWDCCADGKAYVTLLKSSGKGDKAVTNEIAMCVDTACTWNAQQVSGGYAVFTATGKSRSGISAQRNPFGKSGKTYECAEAHTLATNLAAQTKRKLNLYVTYDVGSAVWVIGDERTMKTKYPDLVLPDKAPLTVQVKDTGAVTLAGKLDKTHAASGSSVLSVDGENVAADFVIGKGEKKVVASLAFRQDAEGAVVVSGTAWTQAVE